MSASQSDGTRPDTTEPIYHEHYKGLQVGSYTDQKLRHASAQHLHMTNRRFFIGPIPAGWLQGHRKSWYKSRLRLKNYTSQTLSFKVDPVTFHYNQQENFGDDHQPLSQPLEEEVALTYTHTNNGLSEEEEDITTEQDEAEEPHGELRTLSHPPLEGEAPTQAETETETETDTETETETERGTNNNDTEDDDDGESTPRPSAPASAKARESVYNDGTASSSFVTAREEVSSSADSESTTSTIHPSPNLAFSDQRPQSQWSQNLSVGGPSIGNTSGTSGVPSEADSTTDLLKGKRKQEATQKSQASAITKFTLEHQEPRDEDDTEQTDSGLEGRVPGRIRGKMAKYNLDDNIKDKQQRLRHKIAKTGNTISATRPRRRKLQDGEIIKAERMLVLVEESMKDEIPEDYSENASMRMENRTVDKWREFLVVCRKSSIEHAPFVLQMYRTRVIPDAQSSNGKTRPYYEVRLNHKNTRVNLYSSLDKTIVIWHPCKRGTKIYIIRPKSSAHGAEWYTFIRQVLGWQRPNKLPINVPDLGVSLIFKNPFQQLEARLGLDHDDHQHTTVLSRAAREEKHAAAAIIRGCIEMLEGRPEWAEVLKAWSKTEKMGLAWKRYDRLEWVYGANEENMYGSIAMQSSHELELRPRHHYSTTIKKLADKKEEEPPPLEGFLVRLTSQKGVHQRMNKMFYKRLYFYTEDQHLMFCRPAKALPPAPPKLAQSEDQSIPSAQEILSQAPITWDIDPYPVQDGDVEWLSSGNPEYVQRHDENAYAQWQRKVHNISHADGYIDLCKVREVRRMQWGSSPADPNIEEGPAVDFHPEGDSSRQDDGSTKQFDDDRTFELTLENDLVIRLQAYDPDTRDEWVKRLDALVKYWRARHADDAAELIAVRQRNLKLLEIDEELESIVGQFAEKWEVKKAEASPHLHNMCALSGCRTIKMSGQLYRKPRRHTTFSRCHAVLSDGKLLIFRSTLRKFNGVQIPHIHQEHETTIDLQDCYIYSGLITENDLLYANQTFDSNNPGLRALPRVYPVSDSFTSRDGDTAITFVIWQPLKKNLFRAQEHTMQGTAKRSLRHVSTLGKHGRTIVFKARSRVEKDRWVMSISSEIDRLQEEKHEDIRIVSQ
ncbi:hypothetical protein N7494_008203 [Penicillium frequentans]|uniref:PH domain-containing protein n=1 Tax=Penicillium frequentans TaxID=3151616 RepID=A0AAD6GEX8_9EURO|nr:hypothetical protein N7494_008203 [Penicillium glabrum]